MTTRNLDKLFKPTSITMIGASRRENSVGAVAAKNLFSSGFSGPILPVHPTAQAVEGVLAYSDVYSLPLIPDLAVLCTPPKTIPSLVRALGERGTRAAVVISAGFGDHDENGPELRQQMLEAAGEHDMRLVGPNCLGVMVPSIGLNPSFAHLKPKQGDIALVAQSGAVITSLLDWASAHDIGFSYLVSMGDMRDVDFGDMLDYLAAQPEVRAILLYVEQVTHARKFMSAARAAARQKPVIVIKSGRSVQGAKAASSHTGALAGADAVYDAAFRRAGMLRVGELDELFDAVETLSMGIRPDLTAGGDRLAILTNGGGLGVLAVDCLEEYGGTLAALSGETLKRLDLDLPPTWSHANPVDIIGDAGPARYQAAMEALLEDVDNDAVLVINCPTAVADSSAAAQAVIDTVRKVRSEFGGRKPVLTSWVGYEAAKNARKLISASRIPTYDTPGQAVRAFMHQVKYAKNQQQLMQVPDSVLEDFTPDFDTVQALLQTALEDGTEMLSEVESKRIFEAYGIPTVRTEEAKTAREAGRIAETFEGPYVVKILSPDVTHKSDAGGVVLNIQTPKEVEQTAKRIEKAIKSSFPKARIDGFSVQQMALRPNAYELILGMVEDPTFGPVLLFGEGGTAVELLQDKALALPPLNSVLARDMMSRTRIWKQLQGFRGQPAVALDQLELCLLRLSQLISDHGEIAELDINPLLADADGIVALDARIKVQKAKYDLAGKRLAIRPYPKRLEKQVKLPNGKMFELRPIRPEDEPLLQNMITHMTQEDLRLRFFAPMRRMSRQMAAKLTQIDYDRDMAFVAIGESKQGEKQIKGVVRISTDPNNNRAEYAVMVQSKLKGNGLGRLLMNEIISYAKSRGTPEIYGEVLAENKGMLALCKELGFSKHRNPDDPGVIQVSYFIR